MTQHYTDEERALARQLFVAHNRANGALYPDGFGFLRPEVMAEWFERARQQLNNGAVE